MEEIKSELMMEIITRNLKLNNIIKEQQTKIDKLTELFEKQEDKNNKLNEKINELQDKIDKLLNTNNNTLEKYEQQEKDKLIISQREIKKEQENKALHDQEVLIQMENELDRLKKVTEMFNSKLTMTYGNILRFNNGNGSNHYISIEFDERGSHKYIFNVYQLKFINYNFIADKHKHKQIIEDYIKVKKYVFNDETTPLVEFLFDEIVQNIDDHIKDKKNKEIQNRTPIEKLFKPINEIITKDRIIIDTLTEIKNKYNVRVVYDDRNSVVKIWRDLGLKVFQVQEGDF
jgi:hypothetical protein